MAPRCVSQLQFSPRGEGVGRRQQPGEVTDTMNRLTRALFWQGTVFIDHTRLAAGIAVIACAMICGIPSAAAQNSQPSAARDAEIAGIWLGTLEADGEQVRVVIKISK